MERMTCSCRPQVSAVTWPRSPRAWGCGGGGQEAEQQSCLRVQSHTDTLDLPVGCWAALQAPWDGAELFAEVRVQGGGAGL